MKRFWTKVKIEDFIDCWIWQAAGAKFGSYGQFKLNGKRQRAHRVAWFLTYGIIPDGAIIRHTCDNPSCVNPIHLRLGTPKDNSQDMVTRGRARTGETNHNAKLTTKEVRFIRNSKLSQKTLASKFGVNRCTINRICTRTTWKHIKEN